MDGTIIIPLVLMTQQDSLNQAVADAPLWVAILYLVVLWLGIVWLLLSVLVAVIDTWPRRRSGRTVDDRWLWEPLPQDRDEP